MASAQWAELFQRHGHQSFSIAAPNSPLTNKLKSQSLPYAEMDFREYFSPINSYKLRQLVIKEEFDAIFLQSLRDLWTVSPAVVGLPVQLIGFAQMWLEGINKKDFLHTLVHRRMDQLITLTPRQGAQVLRCIPYSEKNTTVLPNAINPSRFSPQLRSQKLRQDWGVTPSDILIGIVGRLDPQKGQKEAIEAFSLAVTQAPQLPLKLVLVGDPTADSGTAYLEDLQRTVNKHHLDSRVIFAGFRSDIPQVMASLDIFLLNSYREAFGFVIVEAMMSGTAVIATNSGGVPDVLGDGEYGRLVAPKDNESLCKAFIDLSEHHELRANLSQKARTYALDKYDEDKIFQKMIDLLNTLRRTP